MKKITTLFVMFTLVFGLAIAASPTLADTGALADDIRTNTEVIGEVYGEDSGTGELLTTRIANLIRVVLGFLGVVVVIIVIYAGFLWMTAGGKEDQVKKAKDWMINAIIGLAIILSAYAITDFIIERLLDASR
jgi:hypothetical protein